VNRSRHLPVDQLGLAPQGRECSGGLVRRFFLAALLTGSRRCSTGPHREFPANLGPSVARLITVGAPRTRLSNNPVLRIRRAPFSSEKVVRFNENDMADFRYLRNRIPVADRTSPSVIDACSTRRTRVLSPCPRSMARNDTCNVRSAARAFDARDRFVRRGRILSLWTCLRPGRSLL
jgi:hypothetical protein